MDRDSLEQHSRLSRKKEARYAGSGRITAPGFWAWGKGIHVHAPQSVLMSESKRSIAPVLRVIGSKRVWGAGHDLVAVVMNLKEGF